MNFDEMNFDEKCDYQSDQWAFAPCKYGQDESKITDTIKEKASFIGGALWGRQETINEMIQWLQIKQPGESELNATCYRIAGDELKKYFGNKH